MQGLAVSMMLGQGLKENRMLRRRGGAVQLRHLACCPCCAFHENTSARGDRRCCRRLLGTDGASVRPDFWQQGSKAQLAFSAFRSSLEPARREAAVGQIAVDIVLTLEERHASVPRHRLDGGPARGLQCGAGAGARLEWASSGRCIPSDGRGGGARQGGAGPAGTSGRLASGRCPTAAADSLPRGPAALGCLSLDVQVVVRIRPPLPRELNGFRPFENAVLVDPSRKMVTLSENLAALSNNGVENGIVRTASVLSLAAWSGC